MPGRHTRQRRPPIESLETQHSNYSTQTTLKYVDATVTKAICVYPNGPILGRIFANWCSRDMLSDTLAYGQTPMENDVDGVTKWGE